MTYTLDIELDEPLDEAITGILGEVEEAVENIRKYQPAHLMHQVDVDIDELLAKHRGIAVVWDIHDVKDRRPDLSDEQAWEVLRDCREDQSCLDRLRDAMREAILDTADKLYPKRRKVRLSNAAEIIASYGDGDERENLVDLLADAMLWCESFGEPFDEFYGTAKIHFAAEAKSAAKGD
jgi:hypothetical protein